mmetsp:Transcript_40638/g.90365  ORF Transcript_40638/g.90365 Transcript_40638/m.90365 type:complete len:111 (-) Transcript_40638:1405-1737(-)
MFAHVKIYTTSLVAVGVGRLLLLIMGNTLFVVNGLSCIMLTICVHTLLLTATMYYPVHLVSYMQTCVVALTTNACSIHRAGTTGPSPNPNRSQTPKSTIYLSAVHALMLR